MKPLGDHDYRLLQLNTD